MVFKNGFSKNVELPLENIPVHMLNYDVWFIFLFLHVAVCSDNTKEGNTKTVFSCAKYEVLCFTKLMALINVSLFTPNLRYIWLLNLFSLCPLTFNYGIH